MLAVPNPDMIKYTSATVENRSTFNRLKLFFELRRDEESPFTVNEILNTYFVCRTGKSFVSRPGDIIVLISHIPAVKNIFNRLLVRKANGLYALLSLVPGMVLEEEKLSGEYERTYYVMNPQRDSGLLNSLAVCGAGIVQVGVVTRSGYVILRADGETEEVTAAEQPGKKAVISNNGNFSQGYLQGFISAFEGTAPDVQGDPCKAIGAFSAYFDIRSDTLFTYRGAKSNDGLFLFSVSAPSYLPNKRARGVYKILKKHMRKGDITGCAVFNDGNIGAAVSRLCGGEITREFSVPLTNEVWYVLISSAKPVRGGYYLGRI